jgi:hypothetical protein
MANFGHPSITPHQRPLIAMSGKTVTHNGTQTRVVLRKTKISVGCSDITPEALEYVLAEYKKAFGDGEVVLQVGVNNE